ncbi:EAL domain-containing protein [Duganella sp. FT3S]|uniref:EAL domain-containing protein n=1 Tax=Rugamonas fusca TaxID=2758568 RepID=A0A7W2I6V8_9BURK|nr:GGDEF domain-containing phosphodiesterase [Rugamonas fusca]MBA5605703.1 EAL domain-containing protein [Rugamonas fusca]
MGSYSRLFLPIFVIIAVVTGVRYTLLVDGESQAAGARYRQQARELESYLSTALQPALAARDRAALDATLAGALLLNADVADVHLDYPAGHLEALRAAPAPVRHPDWFAALDTVPALAMERTIGPRTTLALRFSPTAPRNAVWHTVRQQAVISAINITIIYALLGLLVCLNQRMLRRLELATNRFQNGDYGVRMPVRGTLEARALARTFNNMAEKVAALVQTLRRSQQQLREEKERIEVTLASIGDAVITTDTAGRIATINAVAQALTGRSEEQARGMELHQVFVLANNFGQHTLLKATDAICAGGDAVKMLNQALRHTSGELANIEYTAAAIRSASGAVHGMVLVFRDVSERRQLIQQMSWQSNHDVLTGLPNRSALAARFEHELARARENQYQLAVCLFDLDHFQHVNDSLGQAVGDALLRQVASRLHQLAEQRQYVARLGGDEFVLLLPALGERGTIAALLQRLLAALERDYLCEGEVVKMSASVGVAIYTGNEASADQLLRHADQALYQAKLTGRKRYHFFDADLDEQVRTHHNRRTEVRAALRAGQLRLHYQPKLDMRSGRIIGMEALLRWQHPVRGMVGPMEFLPIVEHSDIIVDIGEWVLREALRQLQAWRTQAPHWVVSVNIAARHFQRADFVERLGAILAEFPDVPPAMLELEILESSALSDVAHVRTVMQACQRQGISFALDDFGTGYSSLSYLKRLPADTLKIDQSFVRAMLVDPEDLHLVSAIINLARSFGMRIIAEGVETVEHGAMLMRLGCDLAQGYGIARPMPADEVLAWVAAFDSAPLWQAAAQLPPIVTLRGADAEGGAQFPLFAPG